MKQTTVKSAMHWLSRCRIDTCEEERVKCPVCKKYGHVTTHILNPDNADKFQTVISIQHSHFVEEQDAGRNIFCDTKIILDVPSNQRVPRWGLNLAYKNFLKRKYSQEWAK